MMSRSSLMDDLAVPYRSAKVPRGISLCGSWINKRVMSTNRALRLHFFMDRPPQPAVCQTKYTTQTGDVQETGTGGNGFFPRGRALTRRAPSHLPARPASEPRTPAGKLLAGR